ncbi:NUDIX hydrolase [Christiangramia crocea]|uniref:NUDIX domain-containing protein n=1 Tax=Christiangramia crocea TaxID=2904124 RepID=A0A9X2A8J9_9FLAO|nr:NUDIX domain-containing protein [Gramella crocea]MCG9972557.1 NUDIX domain-containing protein [Gramella crocea]
MKKIDENGRYDNNEKLHIATDCIILGFEEQKLKLLLFKRKIEPMKGEWSLIGSSIRLNEDIDAAAQRILKESTGLDKVFMQQLKTYGKKNREPGCRFISIAYYALINIPDHVMDETKEYDARWFEIDEVPNLILDHDEMVKDAFLQLKQDARHKPIGLKLLPEKFTFTQLQKLYEAIFRTEFDERNFRKKVGSLKMLKKLNEKDKSTSRKGAFLYKFNMGRYEKSLKLGHIF